MCKEQNVKPRARMSQTKAATLIVVLTMIVLTLVTLVGIFLWPAFMKIPSPLLFSLLSSSSLLSSLPSLATTIVVKICALTVHILLLVFNDTYLYVHRKAFMPLRYLATPCLLASMKDAAVTNNTRVWYSSTKYLPPTDSFDVLIQSFSRRVRNNNKKKLRCFRDSGIKTVTSHTDTLSLWRDVPVMIDHERVAVHGRTDKSLWAEFIERFVIVFMIEGGYIDRYYEPDDEGNQRPVALSIFVQNSGVLVGMMYFCVESQKSSGIYNYQMLRMMLRATSSSVSSSSSTSSLAPSKTPHSHAKQGSGTAAEKSSSSSSISMPLLPETDKQQQVPIISFVNFLVHMDYAKKCAGAKSTTSQEDEELVNSLYPTSLKFNKTQPLKHIIHTKLDLDRI